MDNRDTMYYVASGLGWGFGIAGILSVLAGYAIGRDIHSLLYLGHALTWYGAGITQVAGAAFFAMLAHDIDRRRD